MWSRALFPKGHGELFLFFGKKLKILKGGKNWLKYISPKKGPNEMNNTAQPEKTPKRCQCVDCKVKLGVVPFSCRCGKYFCGAHRMAEEHNCTFDYRANAKKELLKYMSSPIVGEKVGII
jgi:hypothetical protein